MREEHVPKGGEPGMGGGRGGGCWGPPQHCGQKEDGEGGGVDVDGTRGMVVMARGGGRGGAGGPLGGR